MENMDREPMLELFVFETSQLLEQLEQLVLNGEKGSGLEDSIHEIFRIMHTIKGSAAMMLFDNIAEVAHAVEDLFFFLREEKPSNVDSSRISDLVFEALDFMKVQIVAIQNGKPVNGDASAIKEAIRSYLASLKGQSIPQKQSEMEHTSAQLEPPKYYIATVKTISLGQPFAVRIFFEDGCGMENVRAFTIAHNLKEIAQDIQCWPEDIIDNDESCALLRNEGFLLHFTSEKSEDEIREFFKHTPFIKDYQLTEEPIKEPLILKANVSAEPVESTEKVVEKAPSREPGVTALKQNMISVNLSKLDTLMDLVGELVIAEAMVTRNPELAGLPLEGFYKAARQLRKITNEIQDVTMAIRMVPLGPTFQKMNRLVRDMSHKLNKVVELSIIGEETEVDKNIIDHLADPLMHLIRNAMDHGLETAEERQSKGKSRTGRITLEAKNAGGDVLIFVRDDGRGLNKEKILTKARGNGLIHRNEADLTDREIYNFILLPGFSTKEKVTEFSGRGVGMDVVMKNIQEVGGTVVIDSAPGQGTTMTVKIPLTLAIIDGMIIRVGNSRFIIPTPSIRESFRSKPGDLITDPDGYEMMMIRGDCYSVLRLARRFNIQTHVSEVHDGIVVMVENDEKSICLVADELLGEQQVVVKGLPSYLKRVKGVTGCTLLGDGSVSLILDVASIVKDLVI